MQKVKIFHLFFILVLMLNVGISAGELTPQEIYDLKQKALEKLDYEEFCKYISKENLEGFKEAQDPKQLLFFVKATVSPVEYEFIGQEIMKDKAVVYLKGRKANPKNGGVIEDGFGKATFVREKGEWKYHMEEWQKDPWKR